MLKRKNKNKNELVTKTYLDIQLAKLAKEFSKQLLEQSKQLTTHFTYQLWSLGGRWGKDAEIAFAKLMKEKIEKDFGGKVEKWNHKGKIEHIDKKREEYEVDVVVSDGGKINLIEIKMTVYPEQVENFVENIEAYEYVTGQKSTRRILVTPFASRDAIALAGKREVEIIFPEPSDFNVELSSGNS